MGAGNNSESVHILTIDLWNPADVLGYGRSNRHKQRCLKFESRNAKISRYQLFQTELLNCVLMAKKVGCSVIPACDAGGMIGETVDRVSRSQAGKTRL